MNDVKSYLLRVNHDLLVEVSEDIYNLYRHMNNNLHYNNRKFCHWNVSLDEDILISTKFEYKITDSVEDLVLCHDKLSGIISELCEMDRDILKLLLNGYTDHEIADYLGISLKSVYRRKKKIRSYF